MPLRACLRPVCHALAVLAAGGVTTAALAQESADRPAVNRTEASQIEMRQAEAGTGPGRAYLDPAIRPAPAPVPSATVVQTTADATSRAQGRTPASQISARGQGGPGMVQLSKADLDATLAQLTPAERRVLLQAIEGTDICNDPPNVAAIVALCRTRLETRSAEFANLETSQLSAEDQLLQGEFENATLPSVSQVIERLARGGASSEDFSNQAIASIALGTAAPPPVRPREEEQPGTGNLGEEAQALINALINQLGGRAP
jgi:hypothetical protein